MFRNLLMKLFVFFLFTISMTANISNSHHYFASQSWAQGESCIVCHTPHHAKQDVPRSPLWNHQTTTATYQIYSSTTINASVGQPSGMSKLCLSCHDGTVAVDSYGTVTTGTRYTNTYTNFGTDMRKQHPISFTYDTDLANADGELHDPATTNSGLGKTIAQDLLFDGKMECSSCHDPHASRSTVGCSGCHSMHGRRESLSLRKSNAGSALCLTCHYK